MHRFRTAAFVILVNVASTIVLGEVTCRILSLDSHVIEGLLYQQASDLDVHRVSENPNLLVELRPGSHSSYPGYGGKRTVTINSLGFRDRERTTAKPPGVFRIIVFGGSNTYGGLVNDDETYPAALERLLNSRSGTVRFEVWNAGVSSYVLSQSVEQAKRALKEFDPDLLLFQRTNRGRRAFLLGSDKLSILKINPDLYFENLHWIPCSYEESAACRLTLRASAFARTLVSLGNRAWSPVDLAHRWLSPDRDLVLNDTPLENFVKENQSRVPIVVMDHLCPREPYFDSSFTLVNRADLPPGAGKEYQWIHPPVHVYRYYAKVIMRELERLGLLPKLSLGRIRTIAEARRMSTRPSPIHER